MSHHASKRFRRHFDQLESQLQQLARDNYQLLRAIPSIPLFTSNASGNTGRCELVQIVVHSESIRRALVGGSIRLGFCADVGVVAIRLLVDPAHVFRVVAQDGVVHLLDRDRSLPRTFEHSAECPEVSFDRACVSHVARLPDTSALLTPLRGRNKPVARYAGSQSMCSPG